MLPPSRRNPHQVAQLPMLRNMKQRKEKARMLQDPKRIIARMRTYVSSTNSYTDWKNYYLEDCDLLAGTDGQLCAEQDMPRGGRLSFFPNFFQTATTVEQLQQSPGTDKEKDFAEPLRNELLGQLDFRQYKIQNGNEARVHVLVSCDSDTDQTRVENNGNRALDATTGYKYHTVQMTASHHISDLPHLQHAAHRAAALLDPKFHPQEKKKNKIDWNQGCDVLLYRNGNDRIGYHADNAQGETSIFCAILESQTHLVGESVRVLHVRPHSPKKNGGKKSKIVVSPLTEDDMEIEVWADEGDAYCMDGKMQTFYEHSLLPKELAADETNLTKGRRFAMIFRHGEKQLVAHNKDTSTLVTSLGGKKTLTPEERYPFGGLPHLLTEGETYKRTYLLDHYAFSNVQGGVSGIKTMGCNAIIVSQLDPKRHEQDNLVSLQYTASGMQRGGALFQSWKTGNAIRVFRSSGLAKGFTACTNAEQVPPTATQLYRYDGLYMVRDCFHQDGEEGERTTPTKANIATVEYTFTLERLPPSASVGSVLTVEELMRRSKQRGTMLRGARVQEPKKKRVSKRKADSGETTKNTPVPKRPRRA